MMDEKRLEEEYRELKRQAAPDLWARIEANLKEHPERDVDMREKKETERNQEIKPAYSGKRRWFYGATAAAAAVVVLAVVRPAMENIYLRSGSATGSCTTAAAQEFEAEGTEAAVLMPEAGAGETMAAAETEAAYDAGMMMPTEAAPSAGMTSETAAAKAMAPPGSAAPGASFSASSGTASGAGPDGGFNTEEYSHMEENGFRSVAQEPVSTFSVDVDTAAYSNIRRMLYAGERIPADAVRIEEMINYFHYDYPEPEAGEPFSVTTEYAACPWNPDNGLLLIGLQAERIDFSEKPASNLVFLLDVSGSMRDSDKLPLVQKAFAMLAENLTEDDRVSIVTYSGYEEVALDGVPGDQTAEIVSVLEGLEASGSTAGASGIQKAYELAEKHFIRGGNNRVIMATDGDLNVGITSEGDLVRLIEEKRKTGVHLSVLGVGTGNLKDNKLEALADHGDGNYSYVDSLSEAKRVLVDEMGGTLITVAKDVKLQLEFNPEQVAEYRLVGYENRLLQREDFDNDQADAGEIGAGHTVTALYEIVPVSESGSQDSSGLKYQKPGETTGSSELLTVSLRYKEPEGDTSRLLEYPVEADAYRARGSDNLNFAAAVAEFGMLLRDSEYKGSATYQSVLELAQPCVRSDEYRKEFIELVKIAEKNEGR